MDPVMARKMWRTLEPYHSMVYFAPGAMVAYEELGLGGRAGYFASRSAPMGAVGAAVVTATFYNFNPSVVAAAIPAAWDHASPEQLVAARQTAAGEALRGLLGEEAVTSPEMEEAADAARRAAEVCPPVGRPLFAGHAGLDWPEEPHLVLWHAATLLREFRGDGHVAALVLAGLDPCEALVTHGVGHDTPFPPEVLKITRGWSDEEWAAAGGRLRERDLLDEDDELTPEGLALRAQIEEMTDQLALAPWEELGEEGCDRLRGLVRPWSKTIAASGIFTANPLAAG